MCLSCHVVTVAVEIKDLEALKAACKRLGWHFREGQTLHRWYGRWVDDSPVPRHLFAEEDKYNWVCALPKRERQTFMKQLLDHCQHVIELPGKQYSVGVFQVGDQYQLSYDWVGDLNDILGSPAQPEVVNPLPQIYTLELEKLKAQALGYLCAETVEQDGTVQLTLTSYGD